MRTRNMTPKERARTLSNTLGKAGRLLRLMQAPSPHRVVVRSHLYHMLVAMDLPDEAAYVYQSWSESNELK